MRSWAVAVTVAAATIGSTSCGDTSKPTSSAAVQVYVATLRDVAAGVPSTGPPDDTELPIIYVVSGGEDRIDARVQADVASTLHAEIDVRFADARAEALDGEEATSPVRDGGHLVAVGPVDGDADPVDLDYELYRSDGEWSRRRMTFDRDGDVWSPTSTSVLEQQGGI